MQVKVINILRHTKQTREKVGGKAKYEKGLASPGELGGHTPNERLGNVYRPRHRLCGTARTVRTPVGGRGDARLEGEALGTDGVGGEAHLGEGHKEDGRSSPACNGSKQSEPDRPPGPLAARTAQCGL